MPKTDRLTVSRPKERDSETTDAANAESRGNPTVLDEESCLTGVRKSQPRETGGKRPYQKGYRAERGLVRWHVEMGIDAKRSFMSKGADLLIDGIGDAEVKARRTLPATVNAWLGERAVLFIRPDRADPAVLMTWQTYKRLVTK